mgnify:FL=1
MASDLRDLAKKIEDLARDHPAYSKAHPAVQNCCDHLSAIARCEEANKEINNYKSDPMNAPFNVRKGETLIEAWNRAKREHNK